MSRRWLDVLIGKGEIEPVIGVFLGLPGAAWWGQSRERFEEIMAQDVMPFLERNYRLAESSLRHAVVGHGWSVANLFLWAFDRGVGGFGAQSGFLPPYYLERGLTPALDGAAPGRLYADWGTLDQENPDWGLDVEAQSRDLAAGFRTAGFEVSTAETPGGAKLDPMGRPQRRGVAIDRAGGNGRRLR